jgi:hypothetical protein
MNEVRKPFMADWAYFCKAKDCEFYKAERDASNIITPLCVYGGSYAVCSPDFRCPKDGGKPE